MNFPKRIVYIALLGLALGLVSGNAWAQNNEELLDGSMIRLDAQKMWKINFQLEVPTSENTKIASGFRAPTISPDGQTLAMVKLRRGADNQLYTWTTKTKQVEKRLENDDVSLFMHWTDDSTLEIRERSQPFFYEGGRSRIQFDKGKTLLRERRPNHAETVVAYDSDDVILMKHNNKTLVISDVTTDRYFAPIVSPRNDFVVFSALSSGIHLYDIAQKSVVFIGTRGNSPSFSPDGRYLVYNEISDDGHVLTQGSIVILDLKEKSFRRVENPNKEIRIRASLSRGAEYIVYEDFDESIYRSRLNL